MSNIKDNARQLAKVILRRRRIMKFISTYYVRLLENRYIGSLVRGYFVHCSTDTGRLSSDQQQVPKAKISKIKRMFVTRYK